MGIFAVESKFLYLRADNFVHDGCFEVLYQNPANTGLDRMEVIMMMIMMLTKMTVKTASITSMMI